MNVVHIITGLKRGGAEAMLEKLILASGRDSPQVSHQVVSLLGLGVIGPRLVSAGIPVHTMELGGLTGTLRGLVRLYRLLRRLPHDTVVQTWMYHADLIGGSLARLCGLRNVYWNLRVAVLRADFSRITYGIVRTCAVLSHKVPRRIVNCRPAVLESHVRLGYSRARCLVIGNGFDTAHFRRDPGGARQTRQNLGVANDDLLIGTVARLHPQKDFGTLARAAAAVCGEVPRARFLWVGTGVDTDQDLSKLLSQLGIADRVLRLGERSDVLELLGAMDVFCMSSRSEGFPNALGEAMACELPCVSTDAGDAAFLLGDRALIVPVQDPARLAAALTRVCSLTPAVRRALGVANRQRVVDTFAITTAWRHYLALYGSAWQPMPLSD